jgi:hypothetical protein
MQVQISTWCKQIRKGQHADSIIPIRSRKAGVAGAKHRQEMALSFDDAGYRNSTSGAPLR